MKECGEASYEGCSMFGELEDLKHIITKHLFV
jgi:hypothetical protein